MPFPYHLHVKGRRQTAKERSSSFFSSIYELKENTEIYEGSPNSKPKGYARKKGVWFIVRIRREENAQETHQKAPGLPTDPDVRAKKKRYKQKPLFSLSPLDGTLVSTCLSLRLFSGGSLLFLFFFFRFSSLCHTFIFWGGSFNSRRNISVRPPISKLSTATCVHVNKGVNFSSFFF